MNEHWIEPIVTRYLHRTSASDDDSPFLSMADFFSLLSLTLIYAVMKLAPQSLPSENPAEVRFGRSADDSGEMVANSKYAYVSLLSRGDAYGIEFQLPTHSIYAAISVSGAESDVAVATDWLSNLLVSSPHPERVVLNMPRSENRPEAHRLFNMLTQAAKERHEWVSTIFSEPPTK